MILRTAKTTVTGLAKEQLITTSKAAASDENIMASWIVDFDTSQLVMPDGFRSEQGWDVTSRAWYHVAVTKKALITEPNEDAGEIGRLAAQTTGSSAETLAGQAETLKHLLEEFHI